MLPKEKFGHFRWELHRRKDEREKTKRNFSIVDKNGVVRYRVERFGYRLNVIGYNLLLIN